MDIINLIRQNKLMYLTEEKLVAEIKKLTNSSCPAIKKEINKLILDGGLFLDDANKISISADRGFIKAKITVNKKGYGFAQVEGKPDFFVPAFAINGAFDGDDCLVEITNKKSDEEIEARVVKVLRRNTTHIVGTYIEGKSKNLVYPDDIKLPQIRIFKPDAGKAKNNDKVWVQLDEDSLDEKNLHGKIVEVLGQAGNVKAEQLSIIRSYNLIDKFSQASLDEASKISLTVNYEKCKKTRADFTAHNVITIDGEDARDFDDALSIETRGEGYNLYVHIADVSHYVKEDSALDKEAFKRGTSVYFPNQVIPMLPKQLSNEICSLKEGEYRLTLSVKMVLNKNFKLISATLHESIIKSRHRMTYTEIAKILEGDEFLIDKYADVYNDILLYRQIAQAFKDERAKLGEIRFNLPEPFILENKAGEIVSIENRVQDEAHEIIESLMVKANECVAKMGQKLPFVYRVHEKPDAEKVARLSDMLASMGISNQLKINGDVPAAYQEIVKKIEGTPKEKILTYLILRTMMKARYAPTCLGHFGLALPYYCHFTSPIRRYPDLLIHRILKSQLSGVPNQEIKIHFAPIVERASIQSSDTEKTADEAERAVDDYKKALYMQKFLGEEFDGIISSVQEFGIFVELENGIEGMIRPNDLPADEYVYDDLSMSIKGKHHSYTIGDAIRVVVSNVNIQLRQIDFDIAGVEKSNANVFVNKIKNANNLKNSKNKGKNSKKFENLGSKTKNSKNFSSKSKKLSSKNKNSAKQFYKFNQKSKQKAKRKKR